MNKTTESAEAETAYTKAKEESLEKEQELDQKTEKKRKKMQELRDLLKNDKDLDIKNSPAFIYTTSNDVVWQQQTADSVGFNYIDSDMSEDSNTLSINNNDLLDIFHTFNMDTNGYVAVEKEIILYLFNI
jgi:ABC-type Fe3+-citrate transport system substrate-binding protein